MLSSNRPSLYARKQGYSFSSGQRGSFRRSSNKGPGVKRGSALKNDSRRGSVVSFHTDNSPLTSIEDEEHSMDQIKEEDEKEDKKEEIKEDQKEGDSNKSLVNKASKESIDNQNLVVKPTDDYDTTKIIVSNFSSSEKSKIMSFRNKEKEKNSSRLTSEEDRDSIFAFK